MNRHFNGSHVQRFIAPPTRHFRNQYIPFHLADIRERPQPRAPFPRKYRHSTGACRNIIRAKGPVGPNAWNVRMVVSPHTNLHQAPVHIMAGRHYHDFTDDGAPRSPPSVSFVTSPALTSTCESRVVVRKLPLPWRRLRLICSVPGGTSLNTNRPSLSVVVSNE